MNIENPVKGFLKSFLFVLKVISHQNNFHVVCLVRFCLLQIVLPDSLVPVVVPVLYCCCTSTSASTTGTCTAVGLVVQGQLQIASDNM
jgi:hypothetical protein